MIWLKVAQVLPDIIRLAYTLVNSREYHVEKSKADVEYMKKKVEEERMSVEELRQHLKEMDAAFKEGDSDKLNKVFNSI